MSINGSGVITLNSNADYEQKTSYAATVRVSDSVGSTTKSLNVSIADIETDNGVVHVINAVLVPSDLNIYDVNILQSQDDYLYSIDIMGRKINNVLYHQIIFDVYSSGKVVKRFITKN